MAGIFGIISSNEITFSKQQINDAMQSLTLEPEKVQIEWNVYDNFIYGNCLPISAKKSKPIISNKKLGIDCIIEGNCFIEPKIRKLLEGKYPIEKDLKDEEYIPYLYALKKEEIPKYITGWYNIFILDKKNTKGMLFNSRLGILPLFFSHSNGHFIFASKIESILNTGLQNIEFDKITVAEYLLFHYPLSDNSFIKNISTLENSKILQFNRQKLIKEKNYWSVEKLFGKNIANQKESVDIITQAFNDSVEKISMGRGYFAVSLTGGWDGRLVLSSLLNRGRRDYYLYSFGARNSYDVKIPQKIANELNLNYINFLLDKKYVDNEFTNAALNTVRFSQGFRPYKRAHYLKTMHDLAGKVQFVMSGNCGSNILKFANVVPGTVISKQLFTLLENDFALRKFKRNIQNQWIPEILKFNNDDYNELYSRIREIKQSLDKFSTSGEKYYYLLLSRVERKYFGHEINSYNDYLYNFSPFIDLNFLQKLSRTSFWGANYAFNSRNILLRKNISQLYAKMIKRNYKKLIYFDTDKGCSIKELISVLALPKVIYKKFIKNKKQVDAYNTDNTFELISPYYNKNTINDKELMQKCKENDYFASFLLWQNMLQDNKVIKY
ncbi:MAG: hypothetical protein K9M80_02930 [Candidatus Marinimicrobia bacterium]|nr:hypothetical protein [Candidatus Neomarinimicrobiota bacterium]